MDGVVQILDYLRHFWPKNCKVSQFCGALRPQGGRGGGVSGCFGIRPQKQAYRVELSFLFPMVYNIPGGDLLWFKRYLSQCKGNHD